MKEGEGRGGQPGLQHVMQTQPVSSQLPTQHGECLTLCCAVHGVCAGVVMLAGLGRLHIDLNSEGGRGLLRLSGAVACLAGQQCRLPTCDRPGLETAVCSTSPPHSLLSWLLPPGGQDVLKLATTNCTASTHLNFTCYWCPPRR